MLKLSARSSRVAAVVVKLSLSEPAASKTAELPLCLLLEAPRVGLCRHIYRRSALLRGWDVRETAATSIFFTRDGANVRRRRAAAEKHLRGWVSTGRSEALKDLRLRKC